jgi:hypothetical protein
LYRVLTFVILGSVVACGDPPPRSPAVDPAMVAAISAESARAAVVSQLPPSSRWDLGRLSERLVRAGVNPRAEDTLPTVPEYARGADVGRFRVGRGGDLVIFLFADSTARRSVTDQLDPLTAAPPGAGAPWGDSPVLIISGNLMAVLVGGSSSLRERVQLAIEAGLPAGGAQ